MSVAALTPCPKCQRLNRVPLDRADSAAPVCGSCQAELALHDGVSELDPGGLQALVARSPLPVVVDFWAPWCGPCRSFAPAFSQAARELSGQVVFAKLNTEEHPEAAGRLGIRGIPTLILFKNGAELDRVSGALPPPALRQWLLSPRAA